MSPEMHLAAAKLWRLWGWTGETNSASCWLATDALLCLFPLHSLSQAGVRSDAVTFEAFATDVTLQLALAHIRNLQPDLVHEADGTAACPTIRLWVALRSYFELADHDQAPLPARPAGEGAARYVERLQGVPAAEADGLAWRTIDTLLTGRLPWVFWERAWAGHRGGHARLGVAT